MHNGFFRVAAAAPPVKVADVQFNCRQIIDEASALTGRGVDIVVFPELSVTAYTCGDLFHQSTLIDGAVAGLESLREASESFRQMIIVGAPLRAGDTLYNCAVAIHDGRFIAAVPKTFIPNYNEFYEKRWFSSAATVKTPAIKIGESDVAFGQGIVIDVDNVKVGIEICEDLWAPVPPSCALAMAGAQVIVNLSASNDLIGKRAYLESLIKQQSARLIAGYVYSGAGFGESSTDLVFDGKAIIAENGSIIADSPRWRDSAGAVADIDIEAINRDRMRDTTYHDCATASTFTSCEIAVTLSDADANLHDEIERPIKPRPFVPDDARERDARCEEIINIQAAGLAQRLAATRCATLVVGISGGLDSTLALLVATRAFDRLNLDRHGIIGVTMPGFGTTGRTYNNALELMRSLGVEIREIPIADAVNLHFRDIGHDPKVIDVTYENSQARERTQILMDVANQAGGMVLGTGDLSELALGWATYNGDHMSMYGVNAGVPKTLVRYLVAYFAATTADENERRCLLDICATPISPELTPADPQGHIAQKTEDLVGPYELHDFFLYYTLRYGFSPRRVYLLARQTFKGAFCDEVIIKWMKVFYRRFFNQQFKRSCLPDGPKVGSASLSPRGDWRMPSDASAALWLAEVDKLHVSES